MENKSFNVKTRLSRLLASAKARNIFVNLDVNKYQNLIDCGCFYCGSSLENENGYCLDRVDNFRGYIITNVVACCKICNRAKNNMTILDFVNWLEKAHINTNAKILRAGERIKNGTVYTREDEELAHKEKSQGKSKHRIKYVP